LTLIFTFLFFTGPFIAAEAVKNLSRVKGLARMDDGHGVVLCCRRAVATEVLQPEIAERLKRSAF